MPSRPEFGHLRQDVLVETVSAVEFLDARRNLARAPLADGLLEQALFVGQVEVHHGLERKALTIDD